MEEKPKNINPELVEDDEDESEEDDKKSKVDPKSNFLKELAILIKGIQEKEEKSEKETEHKDLKVDINPELDSEAPVEHLSEVEIEDISRTLARERMDELDGSEENPENDSAKEFLDQVIETGDISFAESEVIADPILPESEVFRINDPTSVGRESIPTNIYHENSNEKKKEAKRSEKLTSVGLIDYLIDRRKARIEKKADSKKDLDKKLVEEVDKLRIKLAESERRVRVEASLIERKTSNSSEDYSTTELKILHKLEKTEDLKESRSIEKPVAVLSKNELVKVAENIKIDGTTLKKIFESHLISENGLRRVISTFLRGGNIKRALNREILQRQIDFEKDPVLRDSFGEPEAEKQEVIVKESVNSLLEKKGINFSNQPFFYQHNAIPKKNNIDYSKKIKKTKPADIILVLVILSLFTLMLVVLLNK